MLDLEIERAMREELKEEKAIVKVLLLGAGECGKSTILKQMKLLYLDGFGPAEKKEYVTLCRKNTLEGIHSLITAVEELPNFSEKFSADEQAAADEVMGVEMKDINNHLEIKPKIELLWKCKAVQAAMERNNEFHFLDSAPFFLEKKNIDRTFAPSYDPTTEDILRARLTTTGIIEINFKMENLKFKMYDVGGQRGERKKWIHCFDDVTAIMFIVAMSEYNLFLAEDRTRNRMEESLCLFEGIVMMEWFQNSAFILFLNKRDLFEIKIKKVDIADYFMEYTGGLDYDAGVEFIKEEYLACNENPENTIYPHVTDATNTENVAFVWKAAKQIITKRQMADIGM